MNNRRRKHIKETIEEINELRVNIKNGICEDSDDFEMLIDSAEMIKSDIENIQYEEEEAFDNLPESLQYSERGDYMQECIDILQSAYDEMDTIPCDVEEIDLTDIEKALESASHYLKEIR